MALIPPFFLDAVVAIGLGDDPVKRNWIGTGFLYGQFEQNMDNNEKVYYVFLVTNKHVLKDINKIWIKFNSLIGTTSHDYEYPLKSRNGRYIWVGHPDNDVDLASLIIDANYLTSHNVRFKFFESDQHTYTISDLKNEGITEGDGVYVLGYPIGLVDKTWQSAICRQGCIARVRDVLETGKGDYLIDAPVFPGNSGGPVILKPSVIAIQGTKPVKKAMLIGVVQNYLPYHDIATSMQTKQARVLFEENSGLAAIIPVDRIIELMGLSVKRIKHRVANARWRVTHSQT